MVEPFLGTVMMFGGNFAIRGWYMCNGAILSIAQNTALFSLLGTTYGGNGQTTFAIPDLRGRGIVHPGTRSGGATYNIGQVSGTETKTLLSTNLPAHIHSISGGSVQLRAVTGAGSVTAPTGNYLASSRSASSAGYAAEAVAPLVALNSGSISGNPSTSIAGSSIPVSIMQPYLAITFLIATEGIFPSRN